MIDTLPQRLQPSEFYNKVREMGGVPIELGSKVRLYGYDENDKSFSAEGVVVGGRLGEAWVFSNPMLVRYRVELADGRVLDSFAGNLEEIAA